MLKFFITGEFLYDSRKEYGTFVAQVTEQFYSNIQKGDRITLENAHSSLKKFAYNFSLKDIDEESIDNMDFEISLVLSTEYEVKRKGYYNESFVAELKEVQPSKWIN